MAALPETLALRTLVVADSEALARTVAGELGLDLQQVGLCPSIAEAPRAIDAHRPTALVIASAVWKGVERLARALAVRAARAPRSMLVLALCDAAAAGDAARLVGEGAIDDYVVHFPASADRHRLATSIRVLARLAATPKASALEATPGKARVVVVEDDEVQHEVMGAILDPDRFELVFVTEAQSALERIRAATPHVVLMDVTLPGGDGVTLTQELKATADLASIPVVMLTGEARLETLVRSMEAGATDFVVKPFTRESLLAKLSKHLPQEHVRAAA